MALQSVAIIFDNKARPDTTGVYCRRALGKLVQVEHFLPTELSRIPRKGFDLYLNIDDGLEYRLPPDLRPCAYWAIDTHLNLPWYLEKTPDFDFVFTAQRDGADRLRQAGIDSATWLPLACDPELHCKHDVSKQHDVCFVGHMFPGPRAEFVELLQRHFPRSFVGQRFFEEMAQTYSASKIVFNRSLRDDINMRVFEALACGSMLLTNDLTDNGQEELFQSGVHLVTYQDGEELLYKARYYLRNEKERERIAAEGRRHVHAGHTYLHRMRTILEAVERGLAKPTVVVTAYPPSDHAKKPEIEANGSASPPAPLHSLSVRPATPQKDPAKDQPSSLLDLVPKEMRSALLIGRSIQSLRDALTARQPCRVTTVDLADVTSTDGKLLDKHIETALASEKTEVVICDEALEFVHNPCRFLRQASKCLGPDGLLVAAIPCVRYHRILRALMQGTWPFERLGDPSFTPPHFYTRRTVEKLFFRAGWQLHQMHMHGELDESGNGNVKGLDIQGLPKEETDEYYASHFLVTAKPCPIDPPGLTSIVILTHDQFNYTRQCLTSIRQYTDEPYEIVVVDNASTDGTQEYLRSQKDIKLIINETNRGFPAAANQGIQASAGQQVLLLNNDTVVTTGWLNRLLRTLYSDPKIGLVGPCSNLVSGEQQVPVRYDDLMGLDDFAWDWGKVNNRKLKETDRLVGFCLLIRRQLIEKIGLLDERFGIGCFEDDDYCLRALSAGFRAVIAEDSFVHHFGGRTFIGSGVDFTGLMRKNERLFRDKWDNNNGHKKISAVPPAAPQAQPSPEPLALIRAPEGGLLLTRKRSLLSLCMIVRNNAGTIEACLKSIRPWVDEMIVVDTGSTDATPEIAKRLGARVFHFPWCDSFSAARNESLKYARGQWIFWMDSDDTIDEVNGRELRVLAQAKHDSKVLGFVMQVHCPGAGDDGDTDVTIVDHVKLFRNLPELRFERRIHEQIIPAIRRAGGEIEWTDVFVVHTGYDHSPEGQERKKERDLHLLHLELKEEPDHPFTLFNLGMTYADFKMHEEAVGYLRRSIRNSGYGESHVRKAYALLTHSLQQLQQMDEAWAACREGLRQFPNDAELLFRKAGLLHEEESLTEAVQAYHKVLQAREERHFSSVVRGLQGHLARHNLAVVLRDLGKLEEAEDQWRRIVGEKPRYREGWRGLGETLLAQRKFEEADDLGKRLVYDKALRVEGKLLLGQTAAARGDAAQARRNLKEAVQARPYDDGVLHTWSRFLFEHGESGEAEKSLQELARLHPREASIHHNLGTAHMQNGKYEAAIKAFRQSLEARPNFALTYLCLGHALQNAGQKSEAVKAWRETLRLDPANHEARELLLQIQM